MMLTLSSGAQATAFVDEPNVDFPLRAHTFASPLDPDRGEAGWYVMGATMAAGSALRWLEANILAGPGDMEAMIESAAGIPAGADGLVFVPYLSGERTPHMDALARGSFIGLTADHDRRHLVQAVLEGTVFALADAVDRVRALTGDPEEIIVAGGGARSPHWVRIVADMLGMPVRTSEVVDQSAVGAAVLAAAADTLRPASEIGRDWARFGGLVEPNPANSARYHELRTVYAAYYPAFADHFGTLAGIPQTG
jgi:xylulokinase